MMVARDGVERFRAACYQQLADSTMDTKDREDKKAISCVRFVCGHSGDEAEHRGRMYWMAVRNAGELTKMNN